MPGRIACPIGTSTLSASLPLVIATSNQRLEKAPLTQDKTRSFAKLRTAASCAPLPELVMMNTRYWVKNTWRSLSPARWKIASKSLLRCGIIGLVCCCNTSGATSTGPGTNIGDIGTSLKFANVGADLNLICERSLIDCTLLISFYHH